MKVDPNNKLKVFILNKDNGESMEYDNVNFFMMFILDDNASCINMAGMASILEAQVGLMQLYKMVKERFDTVMKEENKNAQAPPSSERPIFN